MKLGAQEYDYHDFTNAANSTIFLPDASGIQGQGSDKTIIRLTSDDKTAYPAFPKGSTTTFNVVRSQPGKLVLPGLIKPVFSGFTLIVDPGMQKGGLFNGIRLGYATGAVFDDVEVRTVPGNANVPPGETFGIDLVNCDGTFLRNVRIKGGNVSGAGIGLNRCTDTTLDRCESGDSGSSHGYTAWQCNGVTFLDCVAHGNGNGIGGTGGYGFNHEDTSNVRHVQSRSYANSMGGYRFYASGASTVGHRLIGPVGGIIYAGGQKASDVDVVSI